MSALLEQITDQVLRDSLADMLSRLEIENRLLRERIRSMLIDKYGKGSEKLDDLQLRLLELEPGVSSAEVAKEGSRTAEEKQMLMRFNKESHERKPHPGREEIPAHLPRKEIIEVCTEEQCHCGHCGAEKKVIGYETSERIEIEPVKFYVEKIKREKRACPHCEEDGVATAPAPARIIEKGKAGDALAVNVVVKKYCDYEPLYRQSAEIARETGLHISRSTLCGWVMQIGFLLEYICQALRADLIAGGYIQADETPVKVQNEIPKGKNHQGYLWQYSRPDGPVVFDFRMGRGREGPLKWLDDFNGNLQCDGYSAYAQIGGPGIRYAGCWAHVRRKFYDAWKTSEDETAREIVLRIGALYGVEREAREQGLDHNERGALRQQKSVPLIKELRERIERAKAACLPASLCGKACEYALAQWPRLELYLEKGQVEIDNNWCENAIRPVALGRKNWLHIGSEQAGPRIAAIMSIIETCRRLDINVRDYLLSVLPLVAAWPASRAEELTPTAWKARGNQPPVL